MFERYFNKKRIGRGIDIEDSIMTVTEKEEAMIEVPFKRKNVTFSWYLIILFFLVLLGRIFYLDNIRGEYYQDISKGNRIKKIIIKAPRGKILDKYGQILVKNIPSIDAVAIPKELPDNAEDKNRVIKKISEIFNLDNEEIAAKAKSWDGKSTNPVLIKENISNDQMLIMIENRAELEGVYLEKTAIRNYENSSIFSHIIGYDGKITQEELEENPNYLMTDYIGKTGLEKSYEKYLRGVDGADQIEVDAAGEIKKEIGIINPQPGSDLILNIDGGLQKKIYDSLTSVMEKSGDKTAAAVAINPKNGGILAMVSLPSFDNNMFAKGISNNEYQSLVSNSDLPLFNRVIKGEYPPGSTIKPALAAAALSEGTINEDTSVNCTGGISVGSFHFGDWKTHGVTDIRKAIAESCDTFFYSVGGGYGNIAGLGMEKMKKYDELFGFGEATGVDLSGEMNGFIPSVEWKMEKFNEKWYIGNSYHASIGQGYITATPIQLANYISAIANGGTLYSPKIVSRIKLNNGEEKIISPEVIRKKFISDDVMKIVREGMRQTVESGSAQSLKTLSVPVAGKTGTAQFGTEDKTHAWFVSFAPYDNPEIAMAVLVEGGGEGSSPAVPMTKEVYDYYFSR